jgi:cell division septum initiation protein DivIVA
MTQTELNNLLKQINEAFQDLKDRLEILQCQVDKLEDRVNAKEKRPKTSTSGSKRVQQAQANA